MKLFKWNKGRQKSGYEVWPFFISRMLEMDGYIIKYPTGTSIPPHTDPAPPFSIHHRLNIVLPSKHKGGDFYLKNTPAKPHFQFLGFKLFYFQPSEIEHSVKEITEGTRYVLSFGWITQSDAYNRYGW